MTADKGSRGVAALLQLGLTAMELQALRGNGFIAVEQRPGGRPIHRLRFRVGPLQVTKYLGVDQDRVAQIQNELQWLQSDKRLARELQRLSSEARLVLRESKHNVQQPLAAAGYRFHGRAIRKRQLIKSRKESSDVTA